MQRNGYHEPLGCEHRFYDGALCSDAASVILLGMALCETHFEDRVADAGMGPNGTQAAADLRFAAKTVTAPPVDSYLNTDGERVA